MAGVSPEFIRPNDYSYTVIPKNSMFFLMEGEVLHSKHLDGLDDGSNDMYNPY